MFRISIAAFLFLTFSGCFAMRLRVLDESTGLPIPNSKVTAVPIGIFPLGMPAKDETTTNDDGIAIVRNREVLSSIISVDGMDKPIWAIEFVNSGKPTSDGTIRIEYAGRAIGWPFRQSSRIER